MALVDFLPQLQSLSKEPKQDNEQLFVRINVPASQNKEFSKETREFKFVCKFCNKSFKRKDRLDRHIFTHTKKVFNSQSSFKDSVLIISFQKTFVCDFENCSKEYTNSSHLNRHKKSHKLEPELASVACKQAGCLQTFTNTSNMNRHFRVVHLNPFPYGCHQCDKKFRRKLQLKQHEIKNHTREYPYTCSYCQKGFLSKFMFSRHVTIHKTENRMKTCDECGVKFTNWSQLVEHRRKVHKKEQRYSCDLCDKTFCRKPNIKQHMQLHLSSATEVFQCDYQNCPKFYSAKRNLMSHIRAKHEGRRWTCDLCQRELSSKQKFEQHIESHKMGKMLPKKRSAISKLLGLDVPQSVEHKIMNNEEVELNSLQIVDTSATDLSDC